MDICKWLEKVRIMDERIDAKLTEQKRLMEIATDISSKPYDGMPRSNTGVVNSKVENAVVKILELNTEINKLIDQYVDYKRTVIRALEKLPQKEYSVLHRYYIRYMTWDQIADELHYSRTTVWRYWKKGLKILKDETT